MFSRAPLPDQAPKSHASFEASPAPNRNSAKVANIKPRPNNCTEKMRFTWSAPVRVWLLAVVVWYRSDLNFADVPDRPPDVVSEQALAFGQA